MCKEECRDVSGTPVRVDATSLELRTATEVACNLLFVLDSNHSVVGRAHFMSRRWDSE
jgi:hypothetical protein